MAIIKQDNGRFRAKIAYRNELSKICFKEKVFDTKREAKNFEVDFLRELKNQKNGIITLGNLIDEYFNLNITNANQRTLKYNMLIANKYLGILRDKAYDKLSSVDFLKVWRTIVDSDYSRVSKNKQIHIIKAICKYANMYYGLEDYAITLKIVAKSSTDSKEMQYYTPEEFNQHNQFVNNYVVKALLIFLFRTGCRKNEARTLKKANIKGTSCKIDGTKNYSSTRTIELDHKLLSVIKPLFAIDGDYLFGGINPIN